MFTAACIIPTKIERQASWATIQDSQWKLQWKDSIRTQEQRTFWDSKIDLDVMSRGTAWYNESQEAGLLLLATPDINVLGFAMNPLKTKSDEWVIREIARQGGSIAQEKLDIAFDPSSVPLTFYEAASAQTFLGISMKGTRFLVATPQGDGYVAILRGVHEKDVLVLVSAAQSLSASRANDSAATLLRHPSAEPVIATTDWQTLAEKWATHYGIDARLLKAVVEAEGAQNVAGDHDANGVPHAFGYGQVWPLCHYQNVQRAILDATGNEINVEVPNPAVTPSCPNTRIDREGERILGESLLQNNDASMASAALAVKDYWIAIGSPTDFGYSTYVTFTKKYVGSLISDADLQRRWQIWQRYFP